MAETKKAIQLEEGTYEIIRGRLNTQIDELRSRLGQLNKARKEVFGAIETKLIATDRIHTDNYCIARDIAAIGNQCLFGYNVHVGLRSGIKLADVFSTYNFEGSSFKMSEQSLIDDPKFEQDFLNLYRYYKDAYFAKFLRVGSYLYMVFHLGKTGYDFKSFKWLVRDGKLVYVDNRSDHEVRDPEQYEFRWERATRDVFRFGAHPHVSILDRVFVETVGGDLTIKVEDNTDDGLGIYREPVDSPDQNLDDADYYYADLGNLIVLKIRPYQEDFRYFVFNEKMQEVQRVDTLEKSGILLPDNQGLIFANGYYLQTGEFKMFDQSLSDVNFERRISSPNGEDFLFVFYNREHGVYVLMPYNLIEQKVAVPIICNGFTLFPDGELCYFKAEDEPTKHHVIQIWQTPLVAGDTVPSEHTDNYLYKVGNKDIVKAMAESQEILTLASKEDTYSDLYDDIVKKATDILDSYFWIGDAGAFEIDAPIRSIRQTAETAIDEYEKKVRISRETTQATQTLQKRVEEIVKAVSRQSFDQIDQFVGALAELRQLRGEVIGLKDLRYANIGLIESLENQLTENNGTLSEACVQFLLEENSLQPYQVKVNELEGQLDGLQTATEAKSLDEQMQAVGKELELLIDIVSNLKIEDATQTTRIINHISGMYAHLNQVRAKLKNVQKSLQSTEAEAEFAAQLNLIDQGIINYLDLADSPEECDSYLSKLVVQLEELEGKFVEFDEFIERLAEKREAIFNAFEGRKKQLLEALNNRTSALMRAGERLLNGIQNRAQSFKEATDINSFFAGDLLIDKVRDIVRQLGELGDSNKAGDVQTRLKMLKEDALRQLRDRKDLFVDGAEVIKFGPHQFSVNTQLLDLTVVRRGADMQYHLTGTDFYSVITDEHFLETRAVWDQLLPSENKQVYRSEFLAYQVFSQLDERPADLEGYVKSFSSTRYDEGYVKGVHDADASLILAALLTLKEKMDLLRFQPKARVCAWLYWDYFAVEAEKSLLEKQLSSAGMILKVFPKTHEFDYLRDQLTQKLAVFLEETRLFESSIAPEAADYLFQELTRSEDFIASKDGYGHYEAFLALLKKQKSIKAFEGSLEQLKDSPVPRFQMIRKWVHAYLESLEEGSTFALQDEITMLLFNGGIDKKQVIQASTMDDLEGLHGQHGVLKEGTYHLDFHAFIEKLAHFNNEVLPDYQAFTQLKKDLADQYRSRLRLNEFKPRVLTSFVRNRLIDQVYLPIIGSNLSKQIGTVGDDARTDRMGMLLLISPPGYGKTTLMEYVANRLGMVFMKINGPAIGHRVYSLDPQEAPNMAARQELEKLNLALEMGNNVMLYLDDIQHCDPEFLQKFISLCDAQRKIEGVFNGQSKTYDLRGKRFCVIMAGNPYTESGDQFRIPDMLANRADIYNLGDIIGSSDAYFKMSYVENSLTSNAVLQKLASKNMDDVYTLLKYVETGTQEGLEFKGNHSPEDIQEYAQVLEKMLRLRDVVLKVNQEYIRSAAISDEYRTEPSFKLQGSYRNMNKLAEKIVPIMNEEELTALILDHYGNESQTLTSESEYNLLKFKELMEWLSPEEQARWDEIKATFTKNKVFKNGDGSDPIFQVIAQMQAFSDGLSSIREVLEDRE